mmetsp:Transcript_10926/g.23529  ORF Transcript_10926/g.23529 Transcript_10926/m.23529 type:complete len:327 (-) Transcript_10926:1056-2036(-)
MFTVLRKLVGCVFAMSSCATRCECGPFGCICPLTLEACGFQETLGCTPACLALWSAESLACCAGSPLLLSTAFGSMAPPRARTHSTAASPRNVKKAPLVMSEVCSSGRLEMQKARSGATAAGPSILPMPSTVARTPCTVPTFGRLARMLLLAASTPEAAQRIEAELIERRSALRSIAAVEGMKGARTSGMKTMAMPATTLPTTRALRAPKRRTHGPMKVLVKSSEPAPAAVSIMPSCSSPSASPPARSDAIAHSGTMSNTANMVIPCAARRVATSGSGRRQSTEQSGASASFASAAASAASGGPPAPVSCSRACVECVDDVCCASI